MNELQRQAYLSSLGIENYAPRWILPSAPHSFACAMPAPIAEAQTSPAAPASALSFLATDNEPQKTSPSALSSTFADLDSSKKVPLISNAATILRQLEEKKAPVVQPFSLTIYRPQAGFLIVDSRNTSLALPTELFLKNLMRTYLDGDQFTLAEEVLRWPMIENRFVSRTEDDARNELQTWLAVENELRPIQVLWLMGENAARYWLEQGCDWSKDCWTTQKIKGLPLSALILPSLNQLLKTPAQKSKLWSCLA